jgi:tetratricopeptide (TPR) repeat protein
VTRIHIAIATVISTVALLISFYGIWEKRRDQRQQRLLRLGALVEELNKLSYEQDRLIEDWTMQGRPIPPNLNASNYSRRVVLCNEARSLSAQLEANVDPTQIRVIADNWRRAGRTDLAEPLYRQIIDRHVEDVDTMYAWRGLARLMLESDRQIEAYDCYEHALRTTEAVAPHAAWAIPEQCDTYARWAEVEASMGHRQKALDLLSVVDSLAVRITNISRRNELVNRIQAFRKSELLSSVDVEPTNGSVQADQVDH